MSQEQYDPLHIGNRVLIVSDSHGLTVGHVVYRGVDMIRIMPQENSSIAVEFALSEDGSGFAPELGVHEVEVFEEVTSDYYVDYLGARPGELLEFFTADGKQARPSGTVAEVIKTTEADSIKLTDGTVLNFNGMGPEPPIAVIRVRTAANAAAAAAEGAEAVAASAAAGAAAARGNDLMQLLRSVLPSAAVEVVPMAERSFPDSMQREDLFQDLLSDMPVKQRTNPRRIRFLEREVDLLMALKNNVLARDEVGRVLGAKQQSFTTLSELVTQQLSLPAAISVVAAARVLNLDRFSAADNGKFTPTDVAPRSLGDAEKASEAAAAGYLEGSGQQNFFAYMYDLLGRDQATLSGRALSEWTGDQDILRTRLPGEGPAYNVQGFRAGLPKRDDTEAPPVGVQLLYKAILDRTGRVLAPSKYTHHKSGEPHLIAPSDPSTVVGHVILPPKVALRLRPPTRPGDLAMALTYTASLEADNLPTVAAALWSLYSPSPDPQHAWNLEAGAGADQTIADWLDSTLRYTVHPSESLGPRTPHLLAILDTIGIGEHGMPTAVAAVLWSWVRRSQNKWRSVLKMRRQAIQKALDEEVQRTFQSVTGPDATVWAALLNEKDTPLADLLADIQRRNPTIYKAPTLISASVQHEDQGDAAPLAWISIAKQDTRELELDPVLAGAALVASRSYGLRRKAIRAAPMMAMQAEPDINPCVHVSRLEAIHNIRDVLQRSRLLREFIEEYQGGREGEWVTCALCRRTAVCYHELMELEALATPSRLETIQKQTLIRFGGERYEGKIACKNCGQGLQDIDYDQHVEFDDEGRAVTGASVLTDEQMEESTDSTWKKAVIALAPPPVMFETAAKRLLSEALHQICNLGGMILDTDVMRSIVNNADNYVSARTPTQKEYEATREKMMTAASTKLKSVKGSAVSRAAIDVPTWTAAVDLLRVSALTALLAIALQTATPPIVVNNPYTSCKFSREGWPLDPEAEPDAVGALQYVSCVVADLLVGAPWASMPWAGETKAESRRKMALKAAAAAINLILKGVPKVGHLSFAPDIKAALRTAKTEASVVAIVGGGTRKTDQLPTGFRPDPFPSATGAVVIEKDPLPAVAAAMAANDGVGLAAMGVAVRAASRRQAKAVIGELHAAAAASMAAMTMKPTNMTDYVCCHISFADAEAGGLRGVATSEELREAQLLLRGANPSAPNAGTHLWSAVGSSSGSGSGSGGSVAGPDDAAAAASAPGAPPALGVSDIYYKLFLKYCYRGPQIGEVHEFSNGNRCRQCKLTLGPGQTVADIKDGPGFLAAQLGELRVEMTDAEFNALSDAVRRRRILTETETAIREPWSDGLKALSETLADSASEGLQSLATTLDSVLTAAIAASKDIDEDGRLTVWEPIALLMDGHRTAIQEKLGGAGAAATAAMSIFDIMTEDPFVEGPRALQEYWCAKMEAAGVGHAVVETKTARWFAISSEHSDRINRILSENSLWFKGVLSDEMREILKKAACALGPVIQTWLAAVHPEPSGSHIWGAAEAQVLLRAIVLQIWKDLVSPISWLYEDLTDEAERDAISMEVAAWSDALMRHVKQQYVRYSKERIRQILQQRAELERTSVVEEFENIKDNDLRAAELMLKQFRIGRWAGGKDLRKLDPDRYDAESEQRRRMGIVDAPVEQILMEGAVAPGAGAGQNFGFGPVAEAPEDGYEVNQAAEGDDY
jgi:hypothetical protein